MQHYEVSDALAGVQISEWVTPHVRVFAQDLISRGYALLSTRVCVQAAAHLGRWLEGRAITNDQLTDAVVARFARHHCRCPRSGGGGRPPSRRYVARVRRFVECLRIQGVVPGVPVAPRPMPAPLVGFREWMLQHRGLAPSTIGRYEFSVIKMMPTLGDDSSSYDAALVRRALLTHIDGMTRGYAKCFASALRALLRFLASESRCRPYLDRAVPTIPEWRLSGLPRYLEAADVDRVIRSCSPDNPCRIRDRAVLLLLARLGLRASDVVRMTFNDLDWAAGTVRVRAKSRKEVRLPLPQDVGDAILVYLDRARPSTTIPRVFLCANAPVRAFPTPSTVSNIVALALRRAGIADPPSRGAHLLRHSAATAMLRAGAGLDVIAAVLRHASTDTTAHYAKVDLGLLNTVAQPWPEEVTDAC
jgi:integrase/recombinase XerD